METDEKRKRPRRNFTDEFKASAVALVLKEGKSVAQVARDLDLTPSAFGKWVEQARADAGKSKLRLEREILKKAAAFFAKENA